MTFLIKYFDSIKSRNLDFLTIFQYKFYAPTFLDKLPPALSPFCELQCVGFLYASPFMNTAHQVVTEPIAIINALYCAFIVTNLRTTEKQKYMMSKTAVLHFFSTLKSLLLQ